MKILFIDLIENQKKLFYEQASTVFKKEISWCGGVFHPGLLEDFVAKGVYFQECPTEKK